MFNLVGKGNIRKVREFEIERNFHLYTHMFLNLNQILNQLDKDIELDQSDLQFGMEGKDCK